MALWGNKDQANNSPLFGPALVNKTPSESNRTSLFENNTPDAFITGQTIGTYGNQVTETGPSGWVLKRIGSGGRAGRTFSEVLVAMGSIGAGDVIPSGDSYWINILSNNLSGEYEYYWLSPVVDSNNNIYATGIASGTGQGSYDFIFTKFDTNGNLIWQKSFGTVNSETNWQTLIDQNDDIYIVGSYYNSFSRMIVIKINTEGGIIWQKQFSTSAMSELNDIVLNSVGDLYISGYVSDEGQGNQDAFIAKINSSGNTIYWQKVIGLAGNEIGLSITVDSNDNLYLIIRELKINQFFSSVCKFDSSGNLIWQKYIGYANNFIASSILADSNDNLYICGIAQIVGTKFVLIKIDSDCNIIWQKVIETYADMLDMTKDSQNNIYLCGNSISEGVSILLKYDSSGNLIWQREVKKDVGYVYDAFFGLCLDKNNNIITVGESDDSETSADMIIVKLPNDGSLTGTHGNFIYYETNFTVNTTNFIANTSDLVISNTSYTLSNSNLILANSDLTVTQTIIA